MEAGTGRPLKARFRAAKNDVSGLCFRNFDSLISISFTTRDGDFHAFHAFHAFHDDNGLNSAFSSSTPVPPYRQDRHTDFILRDAPVAPRSNRFDSSEHPSLPTADRRPPREGTPPALMSAHASMPGVLPSHRPKNAAEVPRIPVASAKEPAVCPTDDEAQVPRKSAKDKRSFDYVWRSGVAGGMAGCAVRGLAYWAHLFRSTY